MRLPVRLAHQHPLRKVFAAIGIAIGATLLAAGLHHVPGTSTAMSRLDETFYDSFFHFRKPQDRRGGNVVIVTADEVSLQKLASKNNLHWPWPRILWGQAATYVAAHGAKAVVFDLTFEEPMNFDQQFAADLDKLPIPAVFGTLVDANGNTAPFAPTLAKPPDFGAVNILTDKVVRSYQPVVNGRESLALRAVEAVGVVPPTWAKDPFRLHYYGKSERWDAGTLRRTYSYISAWTVFNAYRQPGRAHEFDLDPEIFRGKIVLFGTSAHGTYDLKSSPLSDLYPGVEIHATAIDNMLANDRVNPLGVFEVIAISSLASFLAAIGVILPRRVLLKILAATVAAVLLAAAGVILFGARTIYWLPMASPTIALLIATVGAFAWSYLTEDRQRRLVVKALGQYVSPEVAAQIQRDPDALKLGGQRREMTVLFSDIQGFTDLSESMASEKLSEMLNFYLGEMSGLILANNGTLDKYIGDAIMTFWNAPIPQPDHAVLACQAALAMRKREAEIQPQLAELGARGLLTRIGINTGPMVFGNMGSPQKFNYSVLGDSVNLGSRLEGANKLYGSRILVAESTVQLAREQFVFRRLDLMRVKGKLKPVSVFELMGDATEAGEFRQRVSRYEEAFAFYQKQEWDRAQEAIESLLHDFPTDLPASALKKRVAALRENPPGADWDGVYVAKEK